MKTALQAAQQALEKSQQEVKRLEEHARLETAKRLYLEGELEEARPRFSVARGSQLRKGPAVCPV